MIRVMPNNCAWCREPIGALGDWTHADCHRLVRPLQQRRSRAWLASLVVFVVPLWVWLSPAPEPHSILQPNGETILPDSTVQSLVLRGAPDHAEIVTLYDGDQIVGHVCVPAGGTLMEHTPRFTRVEVAAVRS